MMFPRKFEAFLSNRTSLSVVLCFAFYAVLAWATNVNSQQPPNKETYMKTEDGFAVVELFTSQGCSSCPSADDNLADITERAAKTGDKIVTLSFHVDYWNYLGWKDPYSLAEATKRQRLYARVHGSKQVYTPQMVVNGTTELLGSNREGSRTAIKSALKKQNDSKLAITSSLKDGEVAVDWTVHGFKHNDLLNLALVQNSAEDRVKSGENNGRTLRHINLVRDFHVVNPVKEQGSLKLRLPEGVATKNLHIVAYLQSPMDASVHAVDEIDIE